MSDIDTAIAQALAALDSTGNDQEAAATDTQVEVNEQDTTTEETDTLAEGESEDTEGSEDEGDTDQATEPLELTEDSVIRIGDKEGKVSDLLEMKADYTRKTQEIAEQRKQVEEREQELEQVYEELRGWVEQRSKDPVAWAAEIATATGNPTALVAALIRSLTDAGALERDFVEAFGLDAPDNPVVRTAKAKEGDDRVAELERKLAEREERERQEARQRELYTEYERQVQSIIEAEGLDFASDAEVQQFRVELFTFAKETGLVDNLTYAYAVMSRQREKAEADKRKRLEAEAAKKRKASVVSKKPGTAGAPVVEPKVTNGSYEEAARLALAKLEAGAL